VLAVRFHLRLLQSKVHHGIIRYKFLEILLKYENMPDKIGLYKENRTCFYHMRTIAFATTYDFRL